MVQLGPGGGVLVGRQERKYRGCRDLGDTCLSLWLKVCAYVEETTLPHKKC